MIFPTADNIASGLQLLATMDLKAREEQLAEFRSANPPGMDDKMAFGYELGLATARAVIRDSAEVVLCEADPGKIL